MAPPTLRGGRVADIEQVRDAIRAIVAEVLGLEDGDLDDDAAWEHGLGGDSLLKLQAIVRIEHAFGLSFDDAVVGQVDTVSDLVQLVGGRAG